MRITAADVERWARALGMWWDEHDDPRHTAFTSRGGRLLWVAESGEEIVVDPLTAALILFGHSHVLRVDVGECQACQTILQFSTREDAREWCVLGGGEFRKCIAAMPPAWSPTTPPEKGRRRWRGEPRAWWGLWLGDHWARCEEVGCPSCAATGRHTLTWEAAIIAARGEPCPCCDGSGDFEDDPEPGCLNCESTGRVCADAPTRESIAVTADAMQEGSGVAGKMVVAWLRGVCHICKGVGSYDWINLRPARSFEGGMPCSTCRSYGAVLGTFVDELYALVESSLSEGRFSPSEYGMEHSR